MPRTARSVQAGLVWPWSGLRERTDADALLMMADWPVDRPRNWLALLNHPLDEKQMDQVRLSLKRGRPLGEARWVDKMADRLDLRHTLRDPGRPKKEKNQ